MRKVDSVSACECEDVMCPGHLGRARCGEDGTATYRRVDAADPNDALRFCDVCGEDALASGLFAIVEETTITPRLLARAPFVLDLGDGYALETTEARSATGGFRATVLRRVDGAVLASVPFAPTWCEAVDALARELRDVDVMLSARLFEVTR